MSPRPMERARSRRLRIAMISYRLPVVGEKRGGIERVAHDLAEGLASRGHEVVVWSHDPVPAGASYIVRRLPWERFTTTWLGRRLTMGYAGNLLALLPKFGEADAIVALGDSLLLPLRGKPVLRVMTGSALGEALSARSPWRFAAQMGVYGLELLTAMAQPCVGISANARQYNPFVRHVVPLGVDLSLFYPEADAKSAAPSILFVGAMGGRKRGALLAEWFVKRVRPVHPDATLHLVTPPGEPIPGVEYHHGLSAEALAALYRSSWVYASPSSYEGFGLPYVEAMASGTPVVASPNPGSREVLGDGRYGVLAPDAGFPAALLALLADRERRRAMAVAGLERAQEYGSAAMIDRYEAALMALRDGEPIVMKAVE